MIDGRSDNPDSPTDAKATALSGCNKSAWDQLFIAIDSAASVAGKNAPEHLQEPHNRKKALNRQEWLQVIVRAAIMKLVLPGIIADVSQAVEEFFKTIIVPHADPKVFAPKNSILDVIYTQDIDEVLRGHEASLRKLFTAMCELKQKTMEHGGLANGLATFANFREFAKTFNLIDLDTTERDVTLCFAFSKMLTIDEQKTKPRIKMTHLSFEDFLETLCRIALMKAMPDEADYNASDARNIGVFLLQQAVEDPERHEAFLLENTTNWGSLPDPDALPTYARRIDMLIEILIAVGQGGLSGDPEQALVLTEKQVRNLLPSRA